MVNKMKFTELRSYLFELLEIELTDNEDTFPEDVVLWLDDEGTLNIRGVCEDVDKVTIRIEGLRITRKESRHEAG